MDDFATGYLAGQDGGNNNGGFFGNEGLWAVIILAIIFGWGTNGYGRNGGDNGMNSYIPYLVGTGATGQGGADTRAALSEGFYADMAKAFLEDADAADGKAYLYWDCIADK